MKRCILGRAGDGGVTATRLQAMFELRHDVFREKLGWAVDSVEGRETDGYDALDPHYLMMVDGFRIVGCARLLPMDGRNMLDEVFRPLLRGEPAPASREVWELSRFAMRTHRRRYGGAATLADDTLAMFREMVAFAEVRGVSEYVAVIATSYERLLRRNGIPLLRFGDGETTRLGDIETVACHIPIDERMHRAIDPASRTIERASA